jgi:hypothetical protein
VTLQIKLDQEKSLKQIGLAQQNSFCPNTFAQFAEAGKT